MGNPNLILLPADDIISVSIDTSGDRVVIGSSTLQQVNSYVRFWNDTWIQEAVITPAAESISRFGDRVFVRGNLVLVGDYAYPNISYAAGAGFIATITPAGNIQVRPTKLNKLQSVLVRHPHHCSSVPMLGNGFHQ